MKKIIPFVFQKNLFISLCFGFILVIVVGTLSHECGHFFMGRYFGYKQRMHYNRTSIYNKNVIPTPSYEKTKEQDHREGFWVSAAGPLETILTGTIGFILLFIFKGSYKQKEKLKIWQWVIIFIALFWLREAVNLIIAFFEFIMNPKQIFHGDEFGLSRALGFDQWFLSIVAGVLAAFVFAIVICKFIPYKQRFTFVIAGVSGGSAGAILWFMILGPWLMP